MKKKIILLIILFVLTVIFSVSIYFLVSHKIDSVTQKEFYTELAEIVNEEKQTDISKQTTKSKTDEKQLKSEYEKLYRENKDMIGWIKIEDTKINYPVMYSPDNPDFYLKHSFDKSYSDYGCPYIQENCNIYGRCDNILIYGHHMQDGSMFADLVKYTDESFYKKHKEICFDTIFKSYKYEIIAVFKTVAYNSDGFRYYDFVNADNSKEFTEYVNKCKELSLYEIGISATYGDRLLTLSTCEYSATNGRIVVVAKRTE